MFVSENVCNACGKITISTSLNITQYSFIYRPLESARMYKCARKHTRTHSHIHTHARAHSRTHARIHAHVLVQGYFFKYDKIAP